MVGWLLGWLVGGWVGLHLAPLDLPQVSSSMPVLFLGDLAAVHSVCGKLWCAGVVWLDSWRGCVCC
jgi:hypothetical protein